MAETEKEKSGLGDFFKEIKNKISGLWNDVLRSINDLCGKEVFKVISKTQENLNNLADDILNLNYNELSDKKINEKEGNILKKLMGNENINKYFERLNDYSTGEDLLNNEKESLLQIVIKVSNNDSNDEISDLTETEMNNIVNFTGEKHKLCESILNSDNEKFKDLPNELKTKQEIVDSCNKVLGDKNWDLNNIKDNFEDIKSKIIEDLEIKNKKTE